MSDFYEPEMADPGEGDLMGALEDSLVDAGASVRCSDCGTVRPRGVIDCPVCDVPRGHVHGRRDLA